MSSRGILALIVALAISTLCVWLLSVMARQ